MPFKAYVDKRLQPSASDRRKLLFLVVNPISSAEECKQTFTYVQNVPSTRVSPNAPAPANTPPTHRGRLPHPNRRDGARVLDERAFTVRADDSLHLDALELHVLLG